MLEYESEHVLNLRMLKNKLLPLEEGKMSNESTRNDKTEQLLEEELKASLVDGRLHCAVAFKISRKLKVSPNVIGDMANRLNIKISKCQLGCFP